MAQSAILNIKILADASKAARTMDQTSTKAQKFGSAMRSTAVPTAALAAGMVLAAKAAAEDAQGQTMLAGALRAATGATDAQVAATEDFIAKTALATGVADDQLRPAMAALARGSGDATQAQKDLSTALDIAAATGKPVETVSKAIAKAYAGQLGPLGKLVPGMDQAAVKAGDMQGAMAELQRLTGGAAAAAAGTAAGQYQRMTVAMDEAKESVGAALLPALQTIAPMLNTVAGFLAKNADVVGPLVIALGALVIVLWAVNAAMSANPVSLIIIGIVALIAVIVVAYKKSDTFRNIVQTAFRIVGAYLSFVWNSILKPVFTFLIAFLKAAWEQAKRAASLIVGAWQTIKSGVMTVWNWLVTNVFGPWKLAFEKAQEVAETLRTAVADAWEAITTAISTAWNNIKGFFDKIIGKIEDVIGWFAKLKPPEWLSNALDTINPFTSSSVAAPAVPGVTATATSPAVATGGRSRGAAPVLNVAVYLDGKRVRGLVEKVVDGKLADEGFRASSGAWG